MMDQVNVIFYVLAVICSVYGVYNIYYKQSILSRGYFPIVLSVFLVLITIVNQPIDGGVYEKISLNEIKTLASS